MGERRHRQKPLRRGHADVSGFYAIVNGLGEFAPLDPVRSRARAVAQALHYDSLCMPRNLKPHRVVQLVIAERDRASMRVLGIPRRRTDALRPRMALEIRIMGFLSFAPARIMDVAEKLEAPYSDVANAMQAMRKRGELVAGGKDDDFRYRFAGPVATVPHTV